MPVQVLVDVFAKDDLLLQRDRRVEIHLPFAHARRVSLMLSAELLPGVRLEIGGVTPQLVLLERAAVMQAHDQRGSMSASRKTGKFHSALSFSASVSARSFSMAARTSSSHGSFSSFAGSYGGSTGTGTFICWSSSVVWVSA